MNAPRLRFVTPIACLALLGCKASPKAPDAPPPAADRSAVGATLTNPIMTCGARQSYERVAEFKCPGGETPLRGNVEAARGARSGALRSPKSGDMVDVYDVPCASGPVSVYVDLYGCAEAKKRAAPGTSEADAIMASFERNEFPVVVRRCVQIMIDHKDAEAAALCMGIAPASMVLSGVDGTEMMAAFCEGMPPQSARSTVRAEVVWMNLQAMVGKAPEVRVPPAVVETAIARFAHVCGVTVDDVAAVRKKSGT